MAALVAGTGCAQLFGLDETTGIDAGNADVASLQVQRVSIGASVLKAPQDLMNQTAAFVQDDGTQTPGEPSAAGTFTAAVPGMPAVMFTVPDMRVPRRLLALPARAQRANFAVFEHASPQEPLAGSQIALDVTLPSPYVSTPEAESFTVQAVGAWMQRTLMPGELPLPDMGLTKIMTTLDYATFTAMTASDKARITSADVVLLTRYTGTRLSGVFQAQFEQTAGTDPMTGTMTAVAADKVLMATLDPAAFTTRYTAVRPGVTGLAMSYRLTAAPGWSVGSDTGVRLASANVGATDTTITRMFGNPFESLDWRTVFSFATSSSRSYSFTDGVNTAAVSLTAGMAMTLEPGDASFALDTPAGLPITIRANLNALTTDGMMLPLDLTKPVEIDAIIDRPTNTLYNVQLVELGFDEMGALTRTTVVDAFTTGMPSLKLPPELFTVGKTYYIRFRCLQGGFPDAATGSLQAAVLPVSVGALDSGVFTVGMP